MVIMTLSHSEQLLLLIDNKQLQNPAVYSARLAGIQTGGY